MPVPPASARATKPTRHRSGVDAAVLGQAAADAAEHLVGAAAAQLRGGPAGPAAVGAAAAGPAGGGG